MGRVIALGIKRRRESKNMSGAKLDAESAPLATFDSNRDEAFRHSRPPVNFSSICGKTSKKRAKIE
jgi:hypothetical protein